MAGTLALSGSVLSKAGANVNTFFTAANAEANIVPLINEAESYVCAVTRKNWVSAYSGLTTAIKLILEEAVSNLAAMYCIQYDMSGYTNLAEAQTMCDILHDGAMRDIELLKDKKVEDFISS